MKSETNSGASPETAQALPKKTAETIDGKAFAAALRDGVASEVRDLRHLYRLQPGLAVLMVGEDPASDIYVRNKTRQAAEVGMKSVERRLPAGTKESELLLIVEGLNDDPAIHGILVQLPLPKHIDADRVIRAIRPEKDVDGLHPVNAGLLATGGEALTPCTPLGCRLMLKDRLGDLSGLNAVIVGRSNIVGKPMAHLLLQENCTVTIAHSRTRDLPALCRGGDILVAAVGRPRFIQGEWIKPGATVIDVGINRLPSTTPKGKDTLLGDVDAEAAMSVAGAITPVPGGVGPVTIACLLRNTLCACKRLSKVK